MTKTAKANLKQNADKQTRAFSPELSATAVLCKTHEMPAYLKKAFKEESKRLEKEIAKNNAKKMEKTQKKVAKSHGTRTKLSNRRSAITTNAKHLQRGTKPTSAFSVDVYKSAVYSKIHEVPGIGAALKVAKREVAKEIALNKAKKLKQDRQRG